MHDLRRAWSDCRSDHFVDDQGRLVMAWAYQTAGRKDGCDEILILGFALKDDPTTGATAEKSRPDVTHEMSACLVDPRTLIDFSTSLFEQQERLQQFISSRFSSTPFQQNNNQQFRGRPF